MCGIAGQQVRDARQIDRSAMEKLRTSLLHRGPDSSGAFVGGETALVATRLAIVDLLHGNQPLHSARGAVLVANAEIYNAPELRERFRDYPFQTRSDCEVIFPLYETHGADFARHLRGMYALALFDPESKSLILSRDQFGIKPLYFTETELGFSFASELGALLLAGLARPQENPIARSEFLQLKFVIGSKTIVEGVRRVGPGETLVVQEGRVSQRRTISEWITSKRQSAISRIAAPFRNSPRALLDQFGDVMRDSVEVHLRADVPACLFYSGGIDSTILMLMARDLGPAGFSALTIGYPGEEDADESRQALDLAHTAGVKCDRIEMTGDDFWALAPRIVAAADDAMADPAMLPLYMLAKSARAGGYKVTLSGEGTDEMFGGYSRYRRATLPNIRFPGHTRRGAFTAISANGFNGWHRDIDALHKSERKIRATRLQTLQAIDLKERLPNCLLVKLDRATMANGVEGRTPFLDKEVASFARQVPDGLKANPLIGKRLLRDWVAAEFPEARPYAKKRGFDVPLGKWLSERREKLVQLVNAQPGIRSAIPEGVVHRAFDECARSMQPAWSLLAYALWHSHHVIGIDATGTVDEVLDAAADFSPSDPQLSPRIQADASA